MVEGLAGNTCVGVGLWGFRKCTWCILVCTLWFTVVVVVVVVVDDDNVINGVFLPHVCLSHTTRRYLPRRLYTATRPLVGCM